MRRVAFHARRMSAGLDLHFFRILAIALAVIVVVSAVVVTILEPDKRSFAGLTGSAYWAVTTVIGSGDSSYVSSPGGYFVGWLLAFFGVAIVAALTAAIVGFVIDFLLKEGQGMGAAGYSDHIVVCGWNPTARELIEELRGDEFGAKVVVLHDSERSPAGAGVYFVRGDTTSTEDLERAGIPDAAAAIVCPSDATNEADMRSILTVMAIESIAPEVRTVVEVNNPKHVDHVRRAHADEILVTSRLASRLLARTALYPGLASLVTDIVSGGAGAELYRVELPDDYCNMTLDELSARLRGEHNATLLAVARGHRTLTNPPADFRLAPGDTAVVVADSLGDLHPLKTDDALGVDA
jgi:voltage-gated potassium channel